MSGRYGDASGRAGGEVPEVIRLGGPSRGAGWRVGAAAVAVFLVGIVVAGRLGMRETPEIDAGPSPTAVALPSVTAPEPAPTLSLTPRPAPPQQPPVVDAVPDLPRHLDGIPTSIGGQKVHRVMGALRQPPGASLLVGGWYRNPACAQAERCPFGSLADGPADRSFDGEIVSLRGAIEPGSGPRVVRGMLAEHCAGPEDARRCSLALSVTDVVWQGDFFSLTRPIEVQPLLGALGFAFPDMNAEPFRDLSRCPLPWPPQTYRSTSGGPRMTLVFPTVADRMAVEDEIVASWPRPDDEAPGQCLDQFMSNPEPAGWLVRDNVMLWLSDLGEARALAEAALADAAALSDAPVAVVPQPITPWLALRALRTWEPALDLLPLHDIQISGPPIEPRVESPLEIHPLNDPFVRVLVVFASPPERRAYQKAAEPTGLVVSGAAGHQRGTIAGELYEWGRERPRWLGHANVLLQLGGPHRFDERLLQTLRSVRPPAGR